MLSRNDCDHNDARAASTHKRRTFRDLFSGGATSTNGIVSTFNTAVCSPNKRFENDTFRPAGERSTAKRTEKRINSREMLELRALLSHRGECKNKYFCFWTRVLRSITFTPLQFDKPYEIQWWLCCAVAVPCVARNDNFQSLRVTRRFTFAHTNIRALEHSTTNFRERLHLGSFPHFAKCSRRTRNSSQFYVPI